MRIRSAFIAAIMAMTLSTFSAMLPTSELAVAQTSVLLPPALAADPLITAAGVEPVRLGMSIDQVRAALPDARLDRSADGEGGTLVTVYRGDDLLMRLYADASGDGTASDGQVRIGVIEALAPEWRTVAGVGPQTRVADVVRAYGPLIRLRRNDVGDREFAEFDHQPNGLAFRLEGPDGGPAGIYLPGTDMTDRVRPGSRVLSILVQGLP